MILSGVFRIGRDAECRQTQSGDDVVTLSLAYNYGKKDADGKRATQWVDAGLWGKRAVSLEQYLLKGQQVWCVVEDLHIESYKKADGTPASKLAGRVGLLEFAGSSQPRQAEDKPAPPPARRPPRPQAADTGQALADMDNDIPF